MAVTTNEIKTRLLREYRERCLRNSRYSLRAYAKSLDVSHSLLSLILSGKREPSMKIAGKLGWTVPPQDKGIELKSSEEKYYELNEVEFDRIATWMHYAVLGLLQLPKFDPSPKVLSKKLGIGIVQAESVWSDLADNGFVKLNGQKWVQVNERLTLSNSSSTPSTREYIRGFLKKAEETLDTERFESRNLTAITFAMDESQVPLAAQAITKFRRDLCKKFENKGKSNRVFTLAVQLFPITQTESKK